LLDLPHHLLIKTLVSLLSKLFALTAREQRLSVHRDVVNAVFLELLRIVGLGQEKEFQGCAGSYEGLDIAGTDID